MDGRFDAMDGRFDAMDGRFDAMDDRLRRVEVLGEDNRHQIRIVAEAVSANARTIEAFRSEVATGFQDLRELLRASHVDMDRRVTRLEEGLSS
jgi:galactokinase